MPKQKTRPAREVAAENQAILFHHVDYETTRPTVIIFRHLMAVIWSAPMKSYATEDPTKPEDSETWQYTIAPLTDAPNAQPVTIGSYGAGRHSFGCPCYGITTKARAIAAARLHAAQLLMTPEDPALDCFTDATGPDARDQYRYWKWQNYCAEAKHAGASDDDARQYADRKMFDNLCEMPLPQPQPVDA